MLLHASSVTYVAKILHVYYLPFNFQRHLFLLRGQVFFIIRKYPMFVHLFLILSV